MATTFRGSCCSGPMTALNTGEIVFAIECTTRSMVRVDVTRILMQIDSVAVATAAGNIMPLITARKVTGVISGGTILTGKMPFDTQQSSDPGVIVRQGASRSIEGNPAIATTGTPVTGWRSFGSRNTTIVGQNMCIDDPCLIKKTSGEHMYLLPGEALIAVWNDGTAPVGGEALFSVLWEEDGLGTEYTVSGTVTLALVASAGAKVVLVTDTDRDLPAPQVEVLTTDGSGNWTKTLASAVKASAFVQTRDGETLYTANGKPYLKKP